MRDRKFKSVCFISFIDGTTHVDLAEKGRPRCAVTGNLRCSSEGGTVLKGQSRGFVRDGFGQGF